jgi:protein-S-isoprenylcysteine O-methyltransferase Ste14
MNDQRPTIDRRHGQPPRSIPLPVPWVYVLIFLAGVGLQRVWPLTSPIHASEQVITVAGAITFSLGAGIAAWGWITFFRAGTTRVPGEASSAFVTWGPYRFTRNPMYLGLAIAYVGEALLTRQVWPVLLFPVLIAYVNWIVIPVEQAKLTDVFGERYAQYMRQVRCWF